MNPARFLSRYRHRRVGAGRATAALAAAALAGLTLVSPALAQPVAAPTVRSTATSGTCGLGPKLVPSCGVLWGAAPSAFDYVNRTRNTTRFEQLQDRSLDIYHAYKVNNQLFPSAEEKSIADGAGGSPRLLLVNYRPGMDMTWAQMASGKGDARLDRLAKHITSTYRDPFFIAIWHEPEHFVKATAGSGMTAKDYRNMVRHVITRLKAKGVTNAVFVQIFQGFPRFAVEPWWKDLYPGDDVIDWIASDSYNSGSSTGYNSGGFAEMVNRTKGSWNGWYNWATKEHPGKPLMLGEWGVYANAKEPSRQGWFYDDVRKNLGKYPAIKAMLYFNANKLDKGTTRIDATASSLAAYKRLTASLSTIDIASSRR